mmetsp:Transcript_143048/g.457129  ORF Transcript_143048/g.457129 Transcript_143048/m.457129 type:complete len:248 (+) Transcript_143048:265-1008(+)
MEGYTRAVSIKENRDPDASPSHGLKETDKWLQQGEANLWPRHQQVLLILVSRSIHQGLPRGLSHVHRCLPSLQRDFSNMRQHHRERHSARLPHAEQWQLVLPATRPSAWNETCHKPRLEAPFQSGFWFVVGRIHRPPVQGCDPGCAQCGNRGCFHRHHRRVFVLVLASEMCSGAGILDLVADGGFHCRRRRILSLCCGEKCECGRRGHRCRTSSRLRLDCDRHVRRCVGRLLADRTRHCCKLHRGLL